MRQLKITNKITERTDITDRYLNEVSPIELITHDKEVELAIRIKKGDKKAEHELVKANLRFVISCAKQYQNRGLSLDDLISEGNYGLIKAAQRFDETRGFKFISYAVIWIRQSILEAINKNSRIVRLPQNKIQQINRLRDVTSKLTQEDEGFVSIEKICQTMEIDYETYTLLVSANSSVSMDKKMSDEDDVTLHDFMSDEEMGVEKHLSDISMKKQLKMALACLDEFERNVITNYYGLNSEGREFTLGEIAEKMDYSSERIRQIKNKCLQKMRKFMLRTLKMTTIER